MACGRFVLEPAAEVAGEMRHPLIGWSVARLLEHLNTALPYLAIAGAIAPGKTNLARQLCEKTPGPADRRTRLTKRTWSAFTPIRLARAGPRS